MSNDSDTVQSHHAFAGLGLCEDLVKAVALLGYQKPTPIQYAAVPVVISGKDVCGLAATGTGKTAAFSLPMLHNILTQKSTVALPYGLVLVPTRELALQVTQAINTLGRHMHIKATTVCGGMSFVDQKRTLQRGVHVVVATPGRARDHLERGTMLLDTVQMVVLDEADEMLDMGFADDLEYILSKCPEKRQTTLFSATLAPHMEKLVAKHLRNPAHINIAQKPNDKTTAANIKECAYLLPRGYKLAALTRLLAHTPPQAALIFCRTRNDVDVLLRALEDRGFGCEPLHGGLSQSQRDRAVERFRNGSSQLLIATDVAARGLDIQHVSHVFNYDLPESPEVYVHRIGRTGRAGRAGIAVSLCEHHRIKGLQQIERVLRKKIDIAQLPDVTDIRSTRFQGILADIQRSDERLPEDCEKAMQETLTQNQDISWENVAKAALRALYKARFKQESLDTIPTMRTPSFNNRSEERGASSSSRRSYPQQRQGAGGGRPSSRNKKPHPRGRGGRPQERRAPQA